MPPTPLIGGSGLWDNRFMRLVRVSSGTPSPPRFAEAEHLFGVLIRHDGMQHQVAEVQDVQAARGVFT